ncbi:EAL domain-containing protein [Sphingomonadaceae bacterium LXI357]|uniref:EAL domain-containing protein n=2 Tax=Stakelama marina TaxID=2826939 RepID=A0A8T4IH83_9SPHN|nr:EAL domain-containing protein [Stakelama marina]MBR0553937.1 EAL domain-containing protein [Stakelama marina]
MLSVRIGACSAPAIDVEAVRVIEVAERALDQARRGGGLVVHDLIEGEFDFDRSALARDLPRALRAGELFVQYQPKVHIRQQEVASAEALIRWQHPTRGLILPGDFISSAEKGGEIGELTIWTLKRVIADQQKLVRAGYDFPIFINISGVLLADAEFVAHACRIIRECDARIGFEITETAVIRDPEIALRHLQEIAAIGVPLAIDDYGAGLSSLAYLKQLPASELKIDKLFVTQLTSSNRDPLIVRSTIDLAHAMEMQVTAEGVETSAALALLGVMGCDLVQGYLISRPIGFDAFMTYLDEDAHLAATAVRRPSFAGREGFWKRA